MGKVLTLLICCVVLGGCAPHRWGRGAGPRREIGAARVPAAAGPAATTGPAAAAGAAAAARVLPKLTAQSPLSDYLRYAALNHPPGVEAAFERWRAAVERVPQVKALPDPRFSYTYFIEEIETRVGAQRQSFTLSQMFPWFGKLELRGDAAAQAAKSQYQKYQNVKLRLFYRVKDAYYECYYVGRAIAITDSNLRLMKRLEGVARVRYKVAAAGHPDVIRAQVELGKLADRLRSLQDLRGPLVARLNEALNRPVGAALALPAKCTEEQVSFTDKQLLQWLAVANPELKSLAFEIEKQKRFIALAKKDYFPDLTVGAKFIDTNASTAGRHPADDGKDAWAITASVNVPIWWEKYAAGVREAKARHRAAQRAKADRANTLDAEVKMTAYHFRDARRKIDLYRDTLLPKATQSLKATEAAYRTAKGSFIDLVDTERIILEFELSYERALTDHGQRLGRLEMLIGRDLPRGKP